MLRLEDLLDSKCTGDRTNTIEAVSLTAVDARGMGVVFLKVRVVGEQTSNKEFGRIDETKRFPSKIRRHLIKDPK